MKLHLNIQKLKERSEPKQAYTSESAPLTTPTLDLLAAVSIAIPTSIPSEILPKYMYTLTEITSL